MTDCSISGGRLPSPRILKPQLSYETIPSWPGKYIYVLRDGKDVLSSYFNFQRTHLSANVTFENFFNMFILGSCPYGSWFHHVRGWTAHEGRPNVLVIHYEDLISDMEATARRLALFCGLEISEETLPQILEHCSFAFMKAHEDKFDHLTDILFEKGFVKGAFIREGKIGRGARQLTEEQRTLFDDAARAVGLALVGSERRDTIGQPGCRQPLPSSPSDHPGSAACV